MLSILHSADWQIGKPFARVQDPDKRARLRQTRIDCIARIGDRAQEQAASLLLVAGDLFDSPTPSSSDVSAVCQAIGRLQIPVLVIPGNHDHGAAGSVWHQAFFQAEQQRRAPNLQVLLERKPLVLQQAIVLPCPLLRRHESDEPTAWIRDLDWSELPSDRPRLLLAHGSVQGFGADDLDADEENPASDRNRLRLDPSLVDLVDYVALGDWHGMKQVNAKSWYSGTPEPDRFPRNADYQGAQVLAVQVSRGGMPQVHPVATGALHWLHQRVEFKQPEDLQRLELLLQEHLGDEPGQHLLLLEESGSLSYEAHQRYGALLERLEAQLLRLKRRGRCALAADVGELDQLTSRADDPLIASVARGLQADLDNREMPPQQRALLHQALAELHRCVGI
ncbi:MAG: exonuclease SbcCD subunit D [Vulcanococcus sp.]